MLDKWEGDVGGDFTGGAHELAECFTEANTIVSYFESVLYPS